jgi:hypothetical protein
MGTVQEQPIADRARYDRLRGRLDRGRHPNLPQQRWPQRRRSGVPNSAQLDAEGRIKIRDGKKQYTSVVTFETAEARERSRRLVLAALAQAGVGA